MHVSRLGIKMDAQDTAMVKDFIEEKAPKIHVMFSEKTTFEVEECVFTSATGSNA